MAISDKITSIQNHLKDDWDSVESLIGDTELDKNIENISTALDDLYNDLPKVTGSGTSITLDDTRKGRLESTLSGNTSQYTTTGKNLLSIPNMTNTHNGITFNLVDNNIMSFSGTATGSWANLNASNLVDNPMISGQTYTFSIDTTQNVRVVLYETSPQTAHVISEGNKSVTFQASGADNIFIGITNLTTNTNYNGIVKMQLELGNTATDWEEYSGGIASPNPDYPQDIHVVSGDNKITVCGKNMFDDSIVTNLWSEYSTNKIVSANGANLHKFNCKQGDTFTLKATYDSASGNSVILIQFFDSNDNSLGRYASANDTTLTLTKTAPANTSYAYMGRYYNTPTTIQLEKNNQATDYEVYNATSYPINLGMENLFKGYANMTNGFLPSNGSYPTTNSSFPNAKYSLIYLKQGQSVSTYGSTNSNGRIRYIDKDINQVIGGVSTTETAYYKSTADYQGSFAEGTITAKKDFILGIMVLTESSQYSDFQITYGTTPQTISPNPIELGVIGTYKDKFIRTNGKNLFDKDSISNGFLDESGIVGGDTSAYRTSDFIPILPNTAYYKTTTSSPRTKYYDKNKQPLNTTTYWDIPIGGNAGTFTTPSNAYYFRFSYPVTGVNVNSIMINKGTTAIDYEPYGSGEWYNYEAISQKILNGSENWGKSSKTQVNRYFVANIFVTILSASSIDLISSYFVCITPNQSDSNNIGLAKYNENGLMVNFSLTDTNFDTLEKFKTWLTSNNVLVRYVLATPTYNKITYEPLLEQLEAYYHAKSKATQTNIFQENNDLPFEIDASALKKWSE